MQENVYLPLTEGQKKLHARLADRLLAKHRDLAVMATELDVLFQSSPWGQPGPTTEPIALMAEILLELVRRDFSTVALREASHSEDKL